MIYGIDLGTTNSIIGHGSTLYTGLVPSSVDIDNSKQVSTREFKESVVRSYKTDMSTGSTGNLARVCSSIILKDLAKRASEATGEPCKDVVISVPAKFSHSQRTAVKMAAEAAGLNLKVLINEPTAAAVAVCKSIPRYVMVYDLGGGTFDVTLLDSRSGSYFVLATDGNGHLGGDNFDRALAMHVLNEAKVPIRYRSRDLVESLVLSIASDKVALQHSTVPRTIDLSAFNVDNYQLTIDAYIQIMKEVFKPSIVLAKKLLNESVMDVDPELVFVGGSTACPYLKAWVAEELGLSVVEDETISPDFTVAQGVALYAEMLEQGRAFKEVFDVTRALSIGEATGMASTMIEEGTPIPVEVHKTFVNSDYTDTLRVPLYQGDAPLVANNDYIGTLEFPYERMVKPGEGRVSVTITVDYNGTITLKGLDLDTAESKEIKLSYLK